MRRLGLSLALAAGIGSPAAAQITVTTPPAGITTVGPADDFASRSFQDPWDMAEFTDLGWLTFGSDQPPVNLSGISIAGGVFSGAPTNGDPNFWLLDSFLPGSAALGKIGRLHPIDSTAYRVLVMRMRVSERPAGDQAMQILWSNNTMFPSEPGGGLRTSNSVLTYEGWNIYIVDLVALGSAAGPGWSGSVDSLRIDPTQYQVGQIELDWARLVPLDNTNLARSVEWTGTRIVDIYVDDDDSEANGTLGLVARGHDGGTSSPRSFSFYVGGLAPGDYHVALRAASSADPLDYSPGLFRVLALPTLSITSPSEEGSSDDFATTQLNDAWDMDSTGDVDESFGLVAPPSAASRAAVDEAGASLGSVPVIEGTSAAATPVGDPILYWLLSAERGWNHRIDADRYRILTYELSLPGARNVLNGSIARVVWKIADETDSNVSQDIVINHRAGADVFARIIADMKTLELETLPGGSPSTSGWVNGGGGNPGINDFRIDPHEFSGPTSFAYRRVKLAAFEKVGSSYTLGWSFSNPSAVATTLRLVADLDRSGCDGITIATGLDPALETFDWTIPVSFNDGEERYICAEVLSGPTVINRTYSAWPIVREVGYTGPLPRLVPERSVLRFGAINDGGVLTARTTPQELVVTQVGAGTANWSVTDDQAWLQVNPQDTSGTSVVTVEITDPGGLPATGVLRATVTINGVGIDNAPQYVDVYLDLKAAGTSAPPIGSFDTPIDGTTGAAGAIPVTGWTLDDVGVDRVEVWRDPVPGLGEGSEIFLGYATFVAGARPDVEAIYEDTTPRAYLAGWGFQVLTNFLPDLTGPVEPVGGNGTFVLHAYSVDEEGLRTLLGSKTISCDNANATAPFGTIDTPTQGGTASGGAFVNFAWALTPQPGTVPIDGSTLFVFIDGVPQAGHPSYNNFRSDIATAFPGYANTNGAVGYFFIDTTAFANGVHTIAWSVTDDLGRSSGIGSRFFSILNGAGDLLPDGAAVQWGDLAQGYGADLGRPRDSLRVAASALPSLSARELDPIDVTIGALDPREGPAAAYLLAGGHLRRLPPGARFDPAEGRFTWTPAPGFVGEYRFAIVEPGRQGGRARLLSVRLEPR